ncbi:MAG: PhoPQ-activated protein PqaA family protein [Verrucomicrobia bacterium]|nr:PhoPQ-activated protein PqaA family protein [Verrucomicrobiota bacterium]
MRSIFSFLCGSVLAGVLDSMLVLAALSFSTGLGYANGETVPLFASLTELFQKDAPINPDRITFSREPVKTVDCQIYEGKTMRTIDFTFTANPLLGLKANHVGRVYLPDPEIPEHARGVAAICNGGNKQGTVLTADNDWIEYLVIQMGVPCVTIQSSFNQRDYGMRTMGQVMSESIERFNETGDAREAGYYALARVFSGMATASQMIPEVKADRFIVSGSSKGGMAAIIACAGDPRIVACYPTAWDTGDLEASTRLKGERWGWDIRPKDTGPAGDSARESMNYLISPKGRYMRKLFDVSHWYKLLSEKFVMIGTGTNDHLHHMMSAKDYFDNLPCKKAFMRVPNTGHGKETVDHAAGWRFSVAAGLLGQSIPEVRLESEERNGEVLIYATLSNVKQLNSLTLYSTTDPVGDYRNAEWTDEVIDPTPVSGERILIKKIAVPMEGTWACFARIIEEGKFCAGINSSNAVEIGIPRIYTLK